MNPFKIEESRRFEDHTYEPLYLANTVFGGQLDLSGTDTSLWSSCIAGNNLNAVEHKEVVFPCTALQTRVFYRNDYFRKEGFWLGRSAILTEDPRYLAHPSMPHRPQVYAASQSLDLRSGIARTEGTLFPGSEIALAMGNTEERKIDFSSKLAFLKDSPLMLMQIEADENTDIVFLPETILEDRLRQHITGRGVCRVGTPIDCDMLMRQQIIASGTNGNVIYYQLQPEGGDPYEVHVSAENGKLTTFEGMPAWQGKSTLSVFVEILPAGSRRVNFDSAEAVFAEQEKRWNAFWKRSSVQLPSSEPLWQQRYHMSLFNVAQSLGEGPAQPVGLSKPNFPHWFGCFHDTDTYFCRPLLEAGHFDIANRNLRFRHRTLPNAKRLARDLGLDGAFYPFQTDLKGNGESREVPTNSGIIGDEAAHQYAYCRSGETASLARDIVRETLLYLRSYLDENSDHLSLRKGPIMTFSETMEAEEPTETVLALKAIARDYLKLHEPRGDDPLALLAHRIENELQIPLDADGRMRITQGKEPEYLRCPSLTLGSFPFHIFEKNAATERAYEDDLEKLVLVFAWEPQQLSVVASQLERREGPSSASAVLLMADQYYKPWHAYDEWENRRTGRAENFITSAGGFACAIHHMLIAETRKQQWSLFPGIPKVWKNVTFDNLHTRAGWKASAKLVDGEIVEITATPVSGEADAEFNIRLLNPLSIDFQIPQGSIQQNDIITFKMNPGRT